MEVVLTVREKMHTFKKTHKIILLNYRNPAPGSAAVFDGAFGMVGNRAMLKTPGMLLAEVGMTAALLFAIFGNSQCCCFGFFFSLFASLIKNSYRMHH